MPKTSKETRKPNGPSLEQLKTKECTLPELQAALVQLIELHNGLNESINKLIDQGRIPSARDALMNTPYGL